MTAQINNTPENVKVILSEVLDALECPENVQKLAGVKKVAGNEMLKMMQFVFPTVIQVQMDILKKHGFPEGREGAVQFAQMVRELEIEDIEVAKLHSQVRSYFLPNVPLNTSIDTSL